MASFELQTPKQRLRFFNVKAYPSLTAVANAVEGTRPSFPLNTEQQYAKAQYSKNLRQRNFNHIEKDKFFPLTQRPVDTEASMRKLDSGALFRSLGPDYATTPYMQPRMVGGYNPLPYGQFYQDPQGVNPTGGRELDIY